MRRSSSQSPNPARDLADLDALVLEEIESLDRGGGQRGRQPGQGPSAASAQPSGGNQRSGRGDSQQAPRPAARIRPRRWGLESARQATGEEAEGLCDEPWDLAGAPEASSADGPTAADLLTPEEQAFVARAVGFLAGRPNADLILDRVWSQSIASRPDGFYDPALAETIAAPRFGATGPDGPLGEVGVNRPAAVGPTERGSTMSSVPRVRPAPDPDPAPSSLPGPHDLDVRE